MKPLHYLIFSAPVVALVALLSGCGTENNNTTPDGTDVQWDIPYDTGDDGGGTDCTPGHIYCDGTTAMTCASDGKSFENYIDCASSGMSCAAGIGCVTCSPGSGKCEDGVPYRCRPDGSGWDAQAPCTEWSVCRAGSCINLCDEARSKNSYIGCEYYAIPTVNSMLAVEFEFAVAIANPQDVDASITITDGGAYSKMLAVPGQTLWTEKIPYIPGLKMESGSEASAIVPNGIYTISSTVPVTVYQFNPLEYRVDGDCSGYDPNPFDGSCFSYTNDASLLLPDHVLTGNYMVMARPTMSMEQGLGTMSHSPGYMAVASPNEVPTTVNITFSCNTLASSDGMTIRAFGPGEIGTFTLNPNDVLQILSGQPPTCINPDNDPPYTYCDTGAQYDLSGTRVSSDLPVVVSSGHNCDFVPFNRWACDHLEEQMFPLEAWGKEYVFARTVPMFTDNPEPNIYKLLSGRDGNVITFDPPTAHPEIILHEGQWVEFESNENFKITGSEGLLVAQFIVGMNYWGQTIAAENGDPAYCLGVPFEQYRDEYTFLAPMTYEMSYVNITAKAGFENTVLLDGLAISGAWAPVGGSGFVSLSIDVVGGSHTISCDDVFGIIVYGVGDYTSYMYPGGLDLEEIFMI
ncbi:MAG: IgGFc-binding protein [Pseudomonadota bacterium]